jgi:hypothetical protein
MPRVLVRWPRLGMRELRQSCTRHLRCCQTDPSQYRASLRTRQTLSQNKLTEVTLQIVHRTDSDQVHPPTDQRRTVLLLDVSTDRSTGVLLAATSLQIGGETRLVRIVMTMDRTLECMSTRRDCAVR